MIKTIRNLIAALLLIGASHGAMAGWESASELLTHCESEDNMYFGACRGYLEAVEDTYHTASRWQGFETGICMPEGVTVGQLVKVWIKYANENPETLHLTASGGVLNAYTQAFPCD
jgi:hypothetical protein